MPDEVIEIVNETSEVIEVVELRGPEGPVGDGLEALEDDTSPSLGGDLALGSYNILGQMENPSLVIDGGLL